MMKSLDLRVSRGLPVSHTRQSITRNTLLLPNLAKNNQPTHYPWLILVHQLTPSVMLKNTPTRETSFFQIQVTISLNVHGLNQLAQQTSRDAAMVKRAFNRVHVNIEFFFEKMFLFFEEISNYNFWTKKCSKIFPSKKKFKKIKFVKKIFSRWFFFTFFRVWKPQKNENTRKTKTKKEEKRRKHTHIKCEKIRGQLKKDKECCFFKKIKNQKEIRRNLFFFHGDNSWEAFFTNVNNEKWQEGDDQTTFLWAGEKDNFSKTRGDHHRRSPGQNLKGFF